MNTPICGLCGKKAKLIKTECCNNWICNDEGKYVIFSYARNSCSRNHRRFTLCGYHNTENHKGNWKTCKRCLNSFDTEDYVWYGTDEYNFEKLPDPPKFEPTLCGNCKHIIKRSEEEYTLLPNGQFFCEICGTKQMNRYEKES